MLLDTQSVKNAATATGATVGFDAGKLVKGRKRLVLTDTLGNILANRVLPANAADGPAASAFWDEVAARHDLLGQVQVVFVDNSFNGIFRAHLAHRYGIRVEKPAHVLVKKTNFCIHAWQWIVERTFAWLRAKRILSKKYDRSLQPAACQCLDYLSQHSASAQILLTQTASKKTACPDRLLLQQNGGITHFMLPLIRSAYFSSAAPTDAMSF